MTLCVKADVEPTFWRLPDWWAYLVPNAYIYGYGLDDTDGLSRDLDEIVTDEPLPAGARTLSREQVEVGLRPR